ncbi:MAG TPA: Ig-like domain-containing protein, partial [Candidatus Dormibacteraeota bacterium]|nr:Ig-like domain-containing protein [Candidatus Dormibacteraeota bacterium]
GNGTVSPDLDGQPLLVGGHYTLTAQPGPGFSFTGWTGDLASDRARLSFVMRSNLTLHASFADLTPPRVQILQPAASARLTNDTVVLQGTADDGDAVSNVEYRVSNTAGAGGFLSANGTTTWSATVSGLTPGINQIDVRARDMAGNVSAESTRSVLLLTSLRVTTNLGGGVSSGFLGTTFRDPGQELSLQAISKPGFLFSNWSGNIESTANPLRFFPSSNMRLQANFVVNPFEPVLGNYNGLFYVGDTTNGVSHETSGAVSFLLSKLGSYSGHLVLAGRRFSFSGRFDLEGRTTNIVKRTGTNALWLDLALDLGGGSDRVVGHVTDPQGGWTAELSGDRALIYSGSNPWPYQGHYTLVFTNRDSAIQLGDSFGTVNINRGRITLSGSLADNTPVTQSVPISKDGQWPLYVALYGGKGSLLSWVAVGTNSSSAESMAGALSWIRPSLPGASNYPDGFISMQGVVGSIYVPPGTNKVLDLDLGELSVEGGNLESSYTNLVALGSANTVTNLTATQ